MNYRVYVCRRCFGKVRRSQAPKCCGSTMTWVMELKVACKGCGVQFLRDDIRQKHCPACTPGSTQRARKWRALNSPTEAAPSSWSLPCAGCRHGSASNAAESGWECGLQAAGRCKPFVSASLYEPRKEAQGA